MILTIHIINIDCDRFVYMLSMHSSNYVDNFYKIWSHTSVFLSPWDLGRLRVERVGVANLTEKENLFLSAGVFTFLPQTVIFMNMLTLAVGLLVL